jgi:hypothetical protein
LEDESFHFFKLYYTKGYHSVFKNLFDGHARRGSKLAPRMSAIFLTLYLAFSGQGQLQQPHEAGSKTKALKAADSGRQAGRTIKRVRDQREDGQVPTTGE